MRIPSLLLIVAALILALPFGWGLGVVIAYLIAGPNFGQLPVGTVPLSIVVSIVFALWPSLSPIIRFTTMAVGAAGFVLLSYLIS
jgi:hypothetical protein